MVENLTEEERLNFQPVDAEGRRRRADQDRDCLLYTSPSPRDRNVSRMPSSA